MGKTRAEIQRVYRERKKQKEGSQYLQKNRERVKKYYIASSELSRSDRKKRNAIKLISNRKMRERKREVAKNPLALKFDFPGRGKAGKTRVRNTITKQDKHIRSLRRSLEKYKKEVSGSCEKTAERNQKDKQNCP